MGKATKRKGQGISNEEKEVKAVNRKNSENWGRSEAKHLLNRAGFGGQPEELEQLAKAGLERSVGDLLNPGDLQLEEPDWLGDYDRFKLRQWRYLPEDERQELQRSNRGRIRDLQIAWINRMITSPTPAAMLQENMTFFWHGHFATSARKVKLPPLLFSQLSLLYDHALGNYKALLHGISRDPAMLRYLDNNQNRKGSPNENFARELMELFSLGPGNYTEQDVKEAARALTGWTNDPFEFRFATRQHDYGQKRFLGATGDFDGEDIVNMILEHPACAEFITRKLLAFFSFDSASEKVVQELANDFRDQDYEIKPLLKNIFTHPQFYDPAIRGIQIKSPIQLVVGTARTLGVSLDNDRFYLYALQMMGQVPYLPPNVKGWQGGTAWIDTSRLLTRYTFAEVLGQGRIPEEIDPRTDGRSGTTNKPTDRALRRMIRQNLRIDFDPYRFVDEKTPVRDAVAQLESQLLSQPLTPEERESLVACYNEARIQASERLALKRLIGDVMTLPAYQLC